MVRSCDCALDQTRLRIGEVIMAKASLSRMNVEALMKLRNQVDKRLLELRADLEKFDFCAAFSLGVVGGKSIPERRILARSQRSE